MYFDCSIEDKRRIEHLMQLVQSQQQIIESIQTQNQALVLRQPKRGSVLCCIQ
jgi:hypothetical protein